MMRAATDADFNAASREIEVKIELYFNGIDEEPLTVTRNNYLIDADWLEEGSAESSNPFGNISSNELSFRLYNDKGMFSPTDASSPYYGLIKSGICVKLYTRPIVDDDEIEWIELGTYFVTDWNAKITSAFVEVVAHDIWYYIFSSPMPNYPVALDKTIHDFLDEFFTSLGYDVDISELLDTVLPYAFITGNMQDFLQEITAAALAYVTTSKSGVPTIGYLLEPRAERATLTDSNQIKDISAKQSITKAYDGVQLTYNIPQVSQIQKLVDVANVQLPPGRSELANVAFSKGPMWQVSSVNIFSTSTDIKFDGYQATPWLITVGIKNNTGETDTADVAVYGTTIDLTEAIITDDELRLLKVSNKYIQTQEYAVMYNKILKAFVRNPIPILSISIRGNPLLNVGDELRIQSDRYNLTFVGVVQRMKYTYAGALSCEMVLLNKEVLQGVTQ